MGSGPGTTWPWCCPTTSAPMRWPGPCSARVSSTPWSTPTWPPTRRPTSSMTAGPGSSSPRPRWRRWPRSWPRQTPGVELRLVIGPEPVAGYDDYDAFVAPHPSVPLEGETEGSAMLYSSGTTGRPKGIRRALSGHPFGADAVLAPMLTALMGFAEGDVYLSPAPLYHSAPLVWSMTAQRLGRHRGGHGALRPGRLPPPDRPSTRSPTPSSSPPCSCACSSSRRPSGPPMTCARSRPWCMPPPPARPRSSAG